MSRDSGQSLVDDTLADFDVPSFDERPPREPGRFAWHKTRKQYVRDEQLCFHIRRMIERDPEWSSLFGRKTKEVPQLPSIPIDAGGASREDDMNRDLQRTLTYLTIPGDELLDVLNVARMCQDLDLRLRFLGFNLPNQHPPTNARRQECLRILNDMGRTTADSSIRLDHFEKVRQRGHLANWHVRKMAPYDVIYLDFCDGLVQGDGAALLSIVEVLNIQLERARKGWLLFLTSRLSPNTVDWRQGRDELGRVLCQNLRQDTQFERSAKDLLGLDWQTELPEEVILDRVPPGKFGQVVALGLCKYLARTLSENHSAWDIELCSNYVYAVEGNTPDMFCLGLRFSTRQISLRHPLDGGLSNSRQEGSAAMEARAAQQFLRKIADQKWVDAILRDPTTYRRYRDRNGELLRRVGYSHESVEAFLDAEERAIFSRSDL